MRSANSLPRKLETVAITFMKELQLILRDDLEAVYLHGANVSPQTQNQVGDLDFQVIVRRRLNSQQKQAIRHLHQAIGRRFPPPGGALDGYYVLLEDARKGSPPTDQLGYVDEWWALHRSQILAGHNVILYGADPETIYASPSWQEIEEALDSEIAFIQGVLQEAPAYCVLNLCRVLYSFRTRNVTISKQEAGEWALKTLSKEHAPLVEAAMRWYRHEAGVEDEKLLKSRVSSFFRLITGEIETVREPGALPG